MEKPESTITSNDRWSQAVTVVGEAAKGVVEAFLAKHQGGELRPHEILSVLSTAINREYVNHYPKPKRAR